MKKEVPDKFKKYEHIESFEQFFQFIKLLDSQDIDKQEHSFLNHVCKNYYLKNLMGFTSEQFQLIYPILKDKIDIFKNSIEQYMDGAIEKAIENKTALDDILFNNYLNHCGFKLDGYFSLLVELQNKNQMEQIAKISYPYFEIFYLKHKGASNAFSIDYCDDIFLKNANLNIVLKHQTYFSSQQLCSKIEDFFSQSLPLDIHFIHLNIHQQKYEVQEKILEHYLQVEHKNISTVIRFIHSIDDKRIDLTGLLNCIEEFILKNNEIETQKTVDRHDSMSEQKYLSENFYKRKTYVNGYQNFLFQLADYKRKNHDFDKLDHFIEQSWLHINQPILDRINNIDYDVELIDFCFKNTGFNHMALCLAPCINFFNDKQQKTFSNIFINEFIAGNIDFSVAEEILKKLNHDKTHIYKDTLEHFKSYCNYEQHKYLFITLEKFLLDHQLSHAVVVDARKSLKTSKI